MQQIAMQHISHSVSVKEKNEFSEVLMPKNTCSMRVK